MTATRAAPFTTTMRVVYRVHRRTANGGSNTPPALRARLTQ